MIPLPSKPKLIKKDKNKAVFQIEGLYPGYGVTLGNALRRVLLSSLEGAAIIQVKIKGVSHEFSTISGVMEDVIMILMNLKKLRFKMFTNEPQTVSLLVKGEKEIKGKDFKLSGQTELTNPEAHIATLTKSSVSLDIEAVVEKGVGYQPSEMREKEKAEVGVLPLDAIFTPIRTVSFDVESMRVGKRTDFDRLNVELETDGTITPQEALQRALDILLKHLFLLFETLGKSEKKEKPVSASAKTSADKAKPKKEKPAKKKPAPAQKPVVKKSADKPKKK